MFVDIICYYGPLHGVVLNVDPVNDSVHSYKTPDGYHYNYFVEMPDEEQSVFECEYVYRFGGVWDQNSKRIEDPKEYSFLVENSSSDLDVVGFDFLNNIMRATFKSGAIYEYYEIMESDYLAFKAAPSKGKHVLTFRNYKRIR